ncbi:hypothetical protein FGB62_28g25 [Gracilaria domingensis]|nr:hypothetical protein FGB62_28g25 [Gracilaria domingensis]
MASTSSASNCEASKGDEFRIDGGACRHARRLDERLVRVARRVTDGSQGDGDGGRKLDLHDLSVVIHPGEKGERFHRQRVTCPLRLANEAGQTLDAARDERLAQHDGTIDAAVAQDVRRQRVARGGVQPEEGAQRRRHGRGDDGGRARRNGGLRREEMGEGQRVEQ